MQQLVTRSLHRAMLQARHPSLRHRCICSPPLSSSSTSTDDCIKTTGTSRTNTRNYSFKSFLNDMHHQPDVKSSNKSRADNKERRNDVTYKKEGRSKKRYNGSVDNVAPRNNQSSSSNFAALEKRTALHLKSFPSDTKNSADYPKLLSRWHNTTNELVMEWTKLWGRSRASHHSHVTPQQIVRGVSLVDDLMNKLLDVIQQEVERALDRSSGAVERIKAVPPSPITSRVDADSSKRVLDTEICCQMIALGWSRCDPKYNLSSPKDNDNAAERAQNILERLEEITQLYDCLPREGRGLISLARREIVPTTRLYNHVLSCWSRSLDSNAEDRALKLFDRMVSGGAYSLPDIFSYNNILHLYANKGEVEKAEALLRQMEEGDSRIKPDVFSYSIIINAIKKRFLTSHDMNDPARAEKIVTEMFKKGVMPNEVCFSTVLTMYTEGDRILRGKSDPGRNWKNRVSNTNNQMSKKSGWGTGNAERALDWMIEMRERGYDIQVNSQHFTTVIDAISKSGRGVEGAKQCEQLCDRLVSFYEKSGADYLRPRPECFGAVINAWSKADKEYASAERAEAALDRMETYFLKEQKDRKYMLSNIAYNLVIDAWSRRSGKDTAQRAEKVLDRMIQHYELTGNKLLRPDVISFTSVMKAYVGHPNGGKKVVKMLEEMNKQCKEGNLQAKADAKTISVAIDACVKSGLVEDASRLLNEVEDKYKNIVMVNTLLSAYKGHGSQGEALLRKMIDLSNQGYSNCSPDSTTYALCISAWGSTHSVSSQQRLDRARALFDECTQGYLNGNEQLKPASTHFNTLANVISTSDHPDKDTMVLSLLRDMESIGCPPCIVTFNILIKACASIEGTAERRCKSLQIAASAFNSIESSGLKADSITYTSMVQAILYLSETSDHKVMALSGIFQRCCADGCLNQHILNTLTDQTTEEEFSAITGGLAGYEHSIQIDDLPAHWSKHALLPSNVTKL